MLSSLFDYKLKRKHSSSMKSSEYYRAPIQRGCKWESNLAFKMKLVKWQHYFSIAKVGPIFASSQLADPDGQTSNHPVERSPFYSECTFPHHVSGCSRPLHAVQLHFSAAEPGICGICKYDLAITLTDTVESNESYNSNYLLTRVLRAVLVNAWLCARWQWSTDRPNLELPPDDYDADIQRYNGDSNLFHH